MMVQLSIPQVRACGYQDLNNLYNMRRLKERDG